MFFARPRHEPAGDKNDEEQHTVLMCVGYGIIIILTVFYSHLNQPEARQDSFQIIEVMPPISTMETSKRTHQHSPSWSGRFGLFRDGRLLPPQENRNRATKRCRCCSVSFASHVWLFEIPSSSDEVLHAAWIQKEDIKRIRAECMATVRKWNNGELSEEGDDEEEEHTMRGLETKPKVAAERARLRKFQSHRAVFDEQHFQAEEGTSDAAAIALLYSDVANSARAISLLQGYNDEQEARKVHNAER